MVGFASGYMPDDISFNFGGHIVLVWRLKTILSATVRPVRPVLPAGFLYECGKGMCLNKKSATAVILQYQMWNYLHCSTITHLDYLD